MTVSNDDSPLGFAPTVAPASNATLAGVPPPPSRMPVVAMAQATPGLIAGDRVGRYVIEQQVGAGGMGEVYAAHDPQLDRRVAIKVLRPLHRAAASAARLLREAQALAKLDHPNVVAIHDVGEADGRVFLAMQFVEGTTLGEHVAAARPPWTQIVALYLAAGRGLAAAHAAGLIHRDFKPSNVLVDRAGVARVTDFGVARAAGDDAVESSGPLVATTRPAAATDGGQTPLNTDMTELGAVIGTPAFMAPEQHAGQRGTARSDQFAFCASLWQSLFGQHPFVPLGHGPVGSSIEYIAFISEGVLVPPPAGHPVPRRIVGALTRGLARRADDRWPTMTALLAALDEQPASTRPTVVVLSTMAALGTGAALWLGIADAGGADPAARCRADADRRLADAWGPLRAATLELRFGASGRPYGAASAILARTGLDRYAADWRTQAVTVCTALTGQARVDPTLLPVVRNREDCLARGLDGLAATAALLGTSTDPELVDSATAVVGGLPPLANCADPERMATLAAPPLAIAVQAAPLFGRVATLKVKLIAGLYRQVEADLPALRRDIDAVGWAPLQVQGLLLEGDLHLADIRPQREPLLAAARLAMTTGLRDEAAGAWTAMVQTEGLIGTTAAVDAYHQVAAAAAAASRDPRRVLRERVQYGRALLRRGLGSRAEEVCAAALADARATPDTEPRDLAGARDCVLECAVRAGHYLQARQLAEEAMADPALVIDAQHPAIADYLEVEAWAYRVAGQPDLARAALTRGLGLRERAFGPRHARVAESLADLADVEPDPARKTELLERALAIAEDPAAAGPRATKVATTVHAALAERAADADDPAGMQRHFERAIAIQAADSGARSLEVGFLLLGYGQYLSPIDLDRALATLRDGEAIIGEHGDPRVAIARGARAHILARAGRWAEALPVLEQIVPTLPPDSEPFNLGLTRWNLARALIATGGDRNRARATALAARADFVRAGAHGTGQVTAIDAWLRAL